MARGGEALASLSKRRHSGIQCSLEIDRDVSQKWVEPVPICFQKMQPEGDPINLNCNPRFGQRVSVPNALCDFAQETGLSFPL